MWMEGLHEFLKWELDKVVCHLVKSLVWLAVLFLVFYYVLYYDHYVTGLVSLTNWMKSHVLLGTILPLLFAWLLLSHSSHTWWYGHLLKQAFSTSKLTSLWGFARWKLNRETMKRVKLEWDILENRVLYPWKFILGTGLHKLLKNTLFGTTWP